MSDIELINSPEAQTELNAKAFKYHVLIAWVGVVLNPVFAIADYFTVPQHFTEFLIIRLVVAFASLITVLFKNKLVNRPEIIVLVPFLSIALLNSYMYSVMNISEFQKHTFAYITLFIAAGMFILWKPIYSIMVVAITLVVSILLFSLNSPLQLSEILINGGLLTASVALFTILLINTRTNLTKREIIARLALTESNNQLAIKNTIIEEKSKDIRDSINYAQRIQTAVLPSFEKIDKVLTDYFIFFKPKDVVSGDFYWYTTLNNLANDTEPSQEIAVIAAADCTGHGVPGALMSIIGSTTLNQSTLNVSDYNPADALAFLNKEISKTLYSIKDGMDICLCAINYAKMELQYAGANNPLYIVRSKQLIEIKADKKAIGADTEDTEMKTFKNNTIPLEKGDMIYLFTDGYADQFGGPNGKKFKYKQLKETLIEISDKAVKTQNQELNFRFEQWRGDLDQVDDILVMGIRV